MKSPDVRRFLVEIALPAAIFVFFFVPVFISPVWVDVQSNLDTPQYVIFEMYALQILIGFCWIEAFYYLRLALFGTRKRPR